MTLKLKRFAIAILAILLTLSIAISFTSYKNTSTITVSADTEAENMLSQTTYVINDKLVLKKTIKFKFNGLDVNADSGVIVYPDGTSYNVSNDEQTFVLDKLGKYTIKYYSSGIAYYDSFFVQDKLYSISDTSGGSITECIIDNSNKNEFYKNLASNVTVARGTYGNVSDPTKGGDSKQSDFGDGLIVRMKEGIKFNYAEPINLNDVSEDGLSNIMSFSMMLCEFYNEKGQHHSVDDTMDGARDIVKSAYITLTDAYDSTNYIQVSFTWESEALYARVSTSEMSSKALNVGSLATATGISYNTEVYYGSQRSIVQTDRYGSACGVKPNIRGYKGKVHLRYDNERGIMYWGQEKTTAVMGGTTIYKAQDPNSTNPSNTNMGTKNIDHNLIMDLKDPAVTGGVVFPGFTTGEVYLSVHFADAQVNEPARIDIYSIGNKNAKDLIENKLGPSAGDYKDEVAPVIKINANPTINNGVYVKVGEYFTVPTADALDVNMKGDVSVNVYRAYGTMVESAVKVEGGKFKVEQKDIYYIVYSATDSYGNVGTSVFKVFGVNKDAINFDNTVDRVSDSVKIMDEADFNLGAKITTLNNYDDLKLKIELVSDKETVVYADLKNGQEIDKFWAEEHNFTVNYAGKYTVRLTYSDNANSYVYEQETFNALPNAEKITFSDKPFIPRILLKDAVYDLQSVDAFGYDNGQAENKGKAKLQISFDGGAFTDIANVRKVEITGSQTAQLRAIYNNSSILSDVAIIKDVNYADARDNYGDNLNVANYFHFEDDAFVVPMPDNYQEGDEIDLVFVSNNDQSSNTIQFANIVSLKNFNFKYQIPKEYSNYNKISFIFTDPYNPENVLNISMYKKLGAVYYSYNGTEVKSNLQFGLNNEKNIGFHEASGILLLDGVTTPCVSDVRFTTPLAYFDIVLEDIRGQAAVYVIAMNGQYLTDGMTDDVEPELISDTLIGKYGIGEQVTLPRVKFVDLLSIVEYDTISTNFMFGDTEAQTSVDGVLLDGTNDPERDYTVQIDSLGIYYYNYFVYDAFGNENAFFMVIEPIDKEAPTIRFSEVKAGDTITVKVGGTVNAKFTVTDNLTPSKDIASNVIIKDCINSIYRPASSTTIKFDTVGRYEISVVSQDQANNIATRTFTVIVKPA